MMRSKSCGKEEKALAPVVVPSDPLGAAKHHSAATQTCPCKASFDHQKRLVAASLRCETVAHSSPGSGWSGPPLT